MSGLPRHAAAARRTLGLACALGLAWVPAATSIVIRHDRDDEAHRALAARYPAAVRVLPDGAGVLVAPRWVLTAAHVADGVADQKPRVIVGDRDVAGDWVVLHPDWQGMGAHDIALLRLAEAVEDVSPAQLYAGDDEEGRVVTFVGNGDFGDGRRGPQQQDGVRRAATNRVESVDDDWITFRFDAPPEGTELEGVSGPGDSGGPALVVTDGALVTLGVSVASRGAKPGRYGVEEMYTRVSTHRAWVESVLAGDEEAGFAPGGRGMRRD